MYKLQLICETCKNIVLTERDVESDDPKKVAEYESALILSAHVLAPHSSSHKLTVRYVSKPPLLEGMEEKMLKITCLHARCKQQNNENTKVEKTCPYHLISACAICFHAAHEGHPFALEWGDFWIVSPCPDGEKWKEENKK